MSEIIVKKITAPGSLPLEISGSRTVKVDHLLTWLGDEVDVSILPSIIQQYQTTVEQHQYNYSGVLDTNWTTIGTGLNWTTGSYNFSMKIVDNLNQVAVYTGHVSFVNKGDHIQVAEVPVVMYHAGESSIELQARINLADSLDPYTLDVKNSGTITATSLDITVVRFA